MYYRDTNIGVTCETDSTERIGACRIEGCVIYSFPGPNYPAYRVHRITFRKVRLRYKSFQNTRVARLEKHTQKSIK